MVKKDEVKTQESSDKVKETSPAGRQRLLRTLVTVGLVVLLIGGLSVLAYENKDRLVAARVDGAFITRAELNKALIESHGSAVLEDLITKKLINDALEDSGENIPQKEIDAEIADIASQVQEGTGMELYEYLESQGISSVEFKNNIRIQLGVEKLLAGDIDVTEESVDQFLEENGEFLQGETEEELRAEAADVLIDQALGTRYQEWLTELKEDAKIENYLE
jgi:parvulin-like peptidyl-prolyl isomerase